MTDDNKASRNTEAFAIVGELVMISSAIDHLLNNVLIEVLDLGTAPLLEPVVATLDPARKVEILKERAAHITAKDWQKGITKFCDKVESVFRQRNIACHTPPVLQDGVWTFKPVAAAKLLKKLEIAEKRVRPVHLGDFTAAIKTGEATLGAGVQLIANFKRYNAEIKRRAAADGGHT